MKEVSTVIGSDSNVNFQSAFKITFFLQNRSIIIMKVSLWSHKISFCEIKSGRISNTMDIYEVASEMFDENLKIVYTTTYRLAIFIHNLWKKLNTNTFSIWRVITLIL